MQNGNTIGSAIPYRKDLKMPIYAQAQKIMRLVKTERAFRIASKSGVLLRVSGKLWGRKARTFDTWRLDMSHAYLHSVNAKG